MSYFTSTRSSERLYSHWKPHFISLPSIQFHGGMRKRCLSVLFTNIWQHCTLPAVTAVSQLPFVLFHLINIVLLLDFPPCLAAHDEQLNGVTVKRVAVLWQHSLDVEVVVLGCHVQPPLSVLLLCRCGVWISPLLHIEEANWPDLKVWRRHASCYFPSCW